MSSDIEATRQSLLDVVLNQRKASTKNTLLSRVVYVARLSQKQNGATHIQGAFDEFLLKCQAKDVDITGIMVVYSWCLVHLFEAKTSSIGSLLRDIQALDPAKTFIQEIKISSVIDDIPSRSFNQNFTGFMDVPYNQQTVDPPEPSLVASTIHETGATLKKIGRTLVSITEMELRNALRSLQSYCEDVPTPQTILSLLAVEESMSISDYLQVFDSPVNIDLDSELLWPMPHSVSVI